MFGINKRIIVLPIFGFFVFCGSMGIMFVLKNIFIKEPPSKATVQNETFTTSAEQGKSHDALSSIVPQISAASILRPFSNSDVAKFLAEVAVLKREYEKKKELLTWKEKMLESMETNLDAEKEELAALRYEITETIKLAGEKKAELKKEVITFEQLEMKNLKKLAAVYGGMKPDKAAAIVKKMDEDTAVKILSLMDGRSSAKILQAVEPDRAVRLSEKIRVVSR
ncbi:MAG: MotE family protein [Candidatus Brocadiales bacterium]